VCEPEGPRLVGVEIFSETERRGGTGTSYMGYNTKKKIQKKATKIKDKKIKQEI